MRSLTLRIIAATVVLGTMVGTALAMPTYNPDSFCQSVASQAGGSSDTIYSNCIKAERQGYDQLNEVWASLADQVQRYCDRVASFGREGSYTILRRCVDAETGAQQK